MSFKRPSLSELREQNKGVIETQIKDIGQLYRFSNLGVIADVQAGMAHLNYGYLDYIAKQATPATATDEWAAAWGALKRIYRKSAKAAICSQVKFTGTDGSMIETGTILTRKDGVQYRLDHKVTIQNGEGLGRVTAILEKGGVVTNAPAKTELAFDSTPLGLESKAVMLDAATGGADIEAEQAFKDRYLFEYQNPPQGGSDPDYVKWAREVPSVTRAWTVRRVMGAGTVGVYIMCDGESVGNDAGFPSGQDGVSSKEAWGAIKATGILGEVADRIYDKQPLTALVFVCSPIKKPIDFEFEGLDHASPTTLQNMKDAINSVFFNVQSLAGKEVILLSELNYAISNVKGSEGYIMKQPSENIRLGVGELPVIGAFNE